MPTLKEQIDEMNDQAQAWIDKDPQNNYTGMLTDSMEYWNTAGIYTAEQLKHFITSEQYVSLFKEAGIKPPAHSVLKYMVSEEIEQLIKDFK